jgi:MFS family permease
MTKGPSTDAPSGSSSLPDSPYAFLRDRNVSLFLLARFIAVIGQQMLVVAVGWELYERTRSSFALGLVGLTQMIPLIVLVLPAGHVADSRNRRKTVVAMELLIAAASIGLALVSFLEAPIGWTYACLAVAGVGRTFVRPASQALLPQLVPREQYSRVFTWNAGIFQTSSVLGPAIGGALIALTHHAVTIYLIDAVAGLVCAAMFMKVRSTFAALPREPASLAKYLAGFRFVHQTRVILGLMVLDTFAVLLGGATALLPVFSAEVLHAGPNGLGLLQAALPAGSVLASAIIAHRPAMQRAGHALFWSVVVFGLATIGFGLSHWFWVSFGMLTICGAADAVSVVVRSTVVQLMTPDAMRGRVSAVNSLFIGTSNEMGGFESGTVAHFFGPVVSVVSGGIGTIVTLVLIVAVWPEIRRFGRLDEIETAK